MEQKNGPLNAKEMDANVEGLLSRPKRSVTVVIHRDRQGVRLLCEDKALAYCQSTPDGLQAAELMAEALGAELPAVGQQAEAAVPTSVVFRAVSLASLDVSIPGIEPLIEQLLQDAAFQRARAATPTEEF